MEFLQHLLAFIFTISLLVTFHEFGHYLVARKCGVKILRFSIGFGKPLYSRRFGADNSELVIAALPLGGYVHMLDESEGQVAEEEVQYAFNRKPLWQRTAIVLAGPVFNFLFAIFAFWLMFMVGVPGLKPIVGTITTDSIAYQAGMRAGDQILSIGSKDISTWGALRNVLIPAIIDQQSIAVIVSNKFSSRKNLTLDLKTISIDDLAEQDLLNHLGITPQLIKIPPIIDQVKSGMPAHRSGLMEGDTIVSVNNTPVDDWRQWVKYVQDHPEQRLTVEVMRQQNYLQLELKPDPKILEDGRKIGFVGMTVKPANNSLFVLERYYLLPALLKAIERTWDMSWLTLKMLAKMLSGQASVKNLSGPISIAQYAGNSAANGLVASLWFLGIVSVSLGVLNLLPIPMLDGGHLLYYLIEYTRRKAVSEAVQIIGKKIGLAILIVLMAVVFYNDILRLIK